MPKGIFYPRSVEGEKRRAAAMPKGESHWNYSENPSKNAIHKWINKYFGKAYKCENEKCTGESKHYEWALLKGRKYAKVRSHFKMLCRKCHTKYDMTKKRKKSIAKGLVKGWIKRRNK